MRLVVPGGPGSIRSQRRIIVLAVAGIVAGAVAACSGSSPQDKTNSTGSESTSTPLARPPEGLSVVNGYADYENCPDREASCKGEVPAALRRPLRLPGVGLKAGCPITRPRNVAPYFGPAAGRGPVYATAEVGVVRFPYPPSRTGPISAGLFLGSKWGGFKVLWIGRPEYTGPVLIRGRQLDGPHAVGFGKQNVPFAEIQLPPGGHAGAPPQGGWRNWPSFTRLHAGGCYAYQVDGTNFSETVVFKAITLPRRRHN